MCGSARFSGFEADLGQSSVRRPEAFVSLQNRSVRVSAVSLRGAVSGSGPANACLREAVFTRQVPVAGEDRVR